LCVHPNVNDYVSFSSLITSPYVVKSYLPCGEKVYYDLYDGEYRTDKIPTKEPDKHLKPLDIVKSYMGDYYHVGVYIGNDLVCHFSKKVNGTRIYL
jgi:hypothetical protein